MGQDIFISYSRHDKELVFPLVNRINQELGTHCWIDLKGIASGEEFEEVIIKAIEESQIVLFMLSDNSLQSKWTKREVYYAEGENKRIVPILINGENLRGWFKFHFGNVDFVDIRSEERVEKLIGNLADWLGLERKSNSIADAKTPASHSDVCDIFLSYSRKDEIIVKSIANKLRERGFTSWLAEEQLGSGEDFKSVIAKTIQKSKVFLFFSSKNSNESPWVIKEVNMAVFIKKPIIPIKLDTAKYDDSILFDLYGIASIDFTSNNIKNEEFEKLVEGLRKKISDSPSPVKELIDNMVKVEGGTFIMGGTEEQGEDVFNDEKPVHSVTLSTFYIGRYPVTQEQWKAVMGNNPSYFQGERHPVEQVDWMDCQEFVEKLSKMTGIRFRLPTEAEWEYAARGGRKGKGYKYSGGDLLPQIAWYNENSSGTSHEVGQKAPNELGLYDMSGNIWEWVHDWKGDYSEEALTNPTGPETGDERVCRGGGWNREHDRCRVSYRGDDQPDLRYRSLGLRVVMEK